MHHHVFPSFQQRKTTFVTFCLFPSLDNKALSNGGVTIKEIAPMGEQIMSICSYGEQILSICSYGEQILSFNG